MTCIRTRVAHWEFEVDAAVTRAAYAEIEAGVRCDCYDCQNFECLGRDAFPPECHWILDEVGVDCLKPANVCRYTRLENGLHLYGGCYHFVGRLVPGNRPARFVDDQTGHTTHTEMITDNARIAFSNRTDLVHDRLVGDPLVQLDVELKLPWEFDGLEGD